MNYIDIHTHKDYNNTDEIFGIRSYCIIDNNNIPNDKPFSAGIHPWDSEKFNNSHFDTLRRLSNKKNLIAIGECGLDNLKGADIQIQKKIFEFHVDLANKTNKPLIIHCVKAYQELIQIHKDMQPKNIWIIHSFNNSETIAKELIKKGIYLSFGPALLKSFSNPYKYFSELDKEYIFAETDDSNHNIQEIYKIAAELKGIELEQFVDIINSNYNRCFVNESVVK